MRYYNVSFLSSDYATLSLAPWSREPVGLRARLDDNDDANQYLLLLLWLILRLLVDTKRARYSWLVLHYSSITTTTDPRP